MVSDPRCPHCSGKVSATATWCMHCGADFEDPVDADTGEPVTGYDHQQEMGGVSAGNAGDIGPKLVGVGLAVLALVTLPWASPADMTLPYLAAVVGVGAYASRRETLSGALRDGGSALAAAPILLWLLSPLFVGLEAFSLGELFRPVVYAVVVTTIVRRMTDPS